MAIYNDFDYWEFSAIVTGLVGIPLGTAVEFVPQTTANPVPLVQPAGEDTDILNDAPRTTWVGIAMKAGEPGDTIPIRPWAAGTMPALLKTTTDMESGQPLYWDGTQFVLSDVVIDTLTVIGTTPLGGGLVELQGAAWGLDVNAYTGHELIIKGGTHENERYFVQSNTANAIIIYSADQTGWIADLPWDIDIEQDNEDGHSRETATNMTSIKGNASAQIVELLALKGGHI